MTGSANSILGGFNPSNLSASMVSTTVGALRLLPPRLFATNGLLVCANTGLVLCTSSFARWQESCPFPFPQENPLSIPLYGVTSWQKSYPFPVPQENPLFLTHSRFDRWQESYPFLQEERSHFRYGSPADMTVVLLIQKNESVNSGHNQTEVLSPLQSYTPLLLLPQSHRRTPCISCLVDSSDTRNYLPSRSHRRTPSCSHPVGLPDGRDCLHSWSHKRSPYPSYLVGLPDDRNYGPFLLSYLVLRPEVDNLRSPIHS